MFSYRYIVVIFSGKVSFKESLGSSRAYTYKREAQARPKPNALFCKNFTFAGNLILQFC